MKFTILCCSLLFCMSTVVKAQSTDSLYLNDGQVLFGKLMGWQKGVISFYVNSGGNMEVPFGLVQQLHAVSVLFDVLSVDGKQLEGRLGSAGPQLLQILAPNAADSLVLPYNKVLSIVERNTAGKRLSGSVGITGSYNKSSDVGLVNLDLLFSYNFKKYSITSSVNSTLSIANTNLYRDRESVVVNGFREINPAWYWCTRLTYLKSREQLLAARYLAAGGLMHYFFNKPNAQAYAFSGIVYSGERSVAQLGRSLAELPLLLHYEMQTWKKQGLTLSTDQTLFVGINGSGRLRHDGEIRLAWSVTRILALSLYVYDNYDSRTLATNDRSLDVGYSVGIKYSY